MVHLIIDDRQIEVPRDTMLFEACRRARGEDLPHFCFHPDLPVAGVCRLCLVEIDGQRDLSIACNTRAREGMVVRTRSRRVLQAVRRVLELHLMNHPVDCPICDRSGECALQDLSMELGPLQSRVARQDKVTKSKAKIIGPHVILDQERCVLCGRCVRFCDEISGTGELGIFHRGDATAVDVTPGLQLDNAYSLNTVDICPVGALTSRDFRFKKRVWLLRSTSAVCPGCATGCNMRVDHEGGRVYRLLPRRNDEVNGPWLCDRGRMVYKELHAQNRLTEPLVRHADGLRALSWLEAMERFLALCGSREVGHILVDCGQSLEELVLLRRLARLIMGRAGGACGLAAEGGPDGDGFLIDADRRPNRRALAWLGLPEVDPGALATELDRAPGALLIHGGDPLQDRRLAEAARRMRVVYLGTHCNATAGAADLVMPLRAWAEKDALWVNRQGRIQRGWRAVAAPGAARQDWRFLAEVLARLGDDPRVAGLDDLRRLVSRELGLDDQDILNRLPCKGLVHEPPAGADDPMIGGR